VHLRRTRIADGATLNRGQVKEVSGDGCHHSR
jgi:hypothetical protein